MKTISMMKETPYMAPTVHGWGRGGHGFGFGQLPEQSTQEQAPLVFYIEENEATIMTDTANNEI